jgi:molybdopterin-guanine dinucleotide biosynthesis protein A
MLNFSTSILNAVVNGLTLKNSFPVPGLYGLVICGGASSRMGKDKSMLDYHGKPQCYHVYEMLDLFCEKVFISCNAAQADKIKKEYQVIIDKPCFSNKGPVSGVLTAFNQYTSNDFLIIGCDYPFLNKDELLNFLPLCNHENLAASFYNEKNELYEPLLAYYQKQSGIELLKMFSAKQYSLQHFLQNLNAEKYFPVNENSIRSINTKAAFEVAMEFINSSK